MFLKSSYQTHKVYLPIGFWCVDPIFNRDFSNAVMQPQTKMEVGTSLIVQVVLDRLWVFPFLPLCLAAGDKKDFKFDTRPVGYIYTLQ